MKICKSVFFLIATIYTIFLTSCACQGIKDPIIRQANGTKLSNPYTIYVSDKMAVNHPVTGYTKKLLPVDNFYRYVPGCYIACYSHNPQNSVYGIGQNIYVKGLVRVNGLYIGRNCQPQGYFFKDISSISYFSNLCQKRITACKNDSCWAGGDTGGWFGIR